MSPKSELAKAEVPQQFAAARRTNRSQYSPRALGAMPYTSTATSSDTVMRSQNIAATSTQPTMIVMAQQMIAAIATSTDGVQSEIQTSADGVTTETMTMQRAMMVRVFHNMLCPRISNPYIGYWY
eukprot:6490952-Amphidinium_carterae.3